MTDVLTEVVQATRDEHDAVSKACFRIPKAVFDDPYPLDPRQNMLHCHPKLPHQMIMGTVGIRSFLTTRFLDRLIDHYIHRRKTLKATILIQFTHGGEAHVRLFRHRFIMFGPRRGRAQELHLPFSEVNDDHILNRVRFFLPLYCCCGMTSSLDRWIGRSVPSIAKV